MFLVRVLVPLFDCSESPSHIAHDMESRNAQNACLIRQLDLSESSFSCVTVMLFVYWEWCVWEAGFTVNSQTHGNRNMTVFTLFFICSFSLHLATQLYLYMRSLECDYSITVNCSYFVGQLGEDNPKLPLLLCKTPAALNDWIYYKHLSVLVIW